MPKGIHGNHARASRQHRWRPGGTGFHGDRVVFVDRVGKAKAGRLLDGVQHDGLPA
jgi:hypothetical protein